MSICVVGNPVFVEAFSLIGVPGHVPEPGRDLELWLTERVQRESIRLLLIQAGVARGLSEDLHERLARQYGCLLLETSGVGEPVSEAAAFRRMVQSAIGAVQ